MYRNSRWDTSLSFRCQHQPRQSLLLSDRHSSLYGKLQHQNQFINFPSMLPSCSKLNSLSHTPNRQRRAGNLINLRSSIRADDDTKKARPPIHLDLSPPPIDVVEDEGLLQAEETEKQIEKYILTGLAGLAVVAFASYCIGSGQSPDQVFGTLSAIDPKKVSPSSIFLAPSTP
jgi:hypothetical protein